MKKLLLLMVLLFVGCSTNPEVRNIPCNNMQGEGRDDCILREKQERMRTERLFMGADRR